MKVILTASQLDMLRAAADHHQQADEYVAGHYGDATNWYGGCAIGCTIRDCQAVGVLPADVGLDDHASLAAHTGIPAEVLHLWDSIFEGLPVEHRPAWTPAALRAVRAGADLSLVWPRFALWLLAEDDSPIPAHARDEAGVRDAVAGVASLYREWVDTGVRPSRERWAAARAAARDAACFTWAASSAARAAGAAWDAQEAARAAARYAARAAGAAAAAARAAACFTWAASSAARAAGAAWDDQEAARTARYAARAAGAAGAAAWDAAGAAACFNWAAWDAAWLRKRDKLLALMAAC